MGNNQIKSKAKVLNVLRGKHSLKRHLARGVLVLCLGIALSCVAFFSLGDSNLRLHQREPALVMGTESLLMAVFYQRTPKALAERALDDAEASLRRVETLMSAKIDHSEIGRLNRTPVNEWIALSPETIEVLETGIKLFRDTDGAFDITCGPLSDLWREAAWRNRWPSEKELNQAKAGTNLIEIKGQLARRLSENVRIDLGGLAKGYAVDLAIESMKRDGARGGLVRLGGEVRVFGLSPESLRGTDTQSWRLQANDLRGEPKGEISLSNRALSTSGLSERFAVIEGRRVSHILDPRTGFGVENVMGAQVTAPTAFLADSWSTALTVLGEEGLSKLPKKVEAQVTVGKKTFHSAGFEL